MALHDTYDYEEDDDDSERENDDRKEEDDKDRKLDNGESELIAILTCTLFNSSYNASAGKISEYCNGNTVQEELGQSTTMELLSRGKGTNISC